MTDEDLRALCKQFGSIISTKIVYDRVNQQSLSNYVQINAQRIMFVVVVGVVEFTSPASALSAVSTLVAPIQVRFVFKNEDRKHINSTNKKGDIGKEFSFT